METLQSFLVQELEKDEFLSPTHRYERELVLVYLRLHAGNDVAWANRLLAGFELDPEPRDWGDGELDTADWNFTGIKLLRLYLDFKDDDVLQPEAHDRLLSLLRTFPQPRVRHNRDNDRRAVWPGIHTENHDLILLTIGYFRAQLRGDDPADHEQHLARSLSWRMRFGWIEANSPTYQTRYVEPLGILIDHAPNPAIREGAEALLNHLIAERAIFSVQGYLAGPQARSRSGPGRPSRDSLLPLLHIWMDAPLPADHVTNPYREAYWLARSSFTPAPAVRALRQARADPAAEPRRYRGMRSRRGGELTEFRYFLSPHVAVGSMDWLGHTSKHRYHNMTLAHPRGEPVALWFYHAAVKGPSDPRFGVNDSVQWGEALLARGDVRFTDGADESRVSGWWVLHTPWAAVAITELPDDRKFAVALDLRREDIALAEAVASLAVPRLTADGDVTWTDRNGRSIRFDLGRGRVAHQVWVDEQHEVRLGGMLHDAPELSSWYGTGIIDVTPPDGPSLRLTTEALDRLLREHPPDAGTRGRP